MTLLTLIWLLHGQRVLQNEHYNSMDDCRRAQRAYEQLARARHVKLLKSYCTYGE